MGPAGYATPSGYGAGTARRSFLPPATDHPRATVSLVLGILSLLLCQLLGPVAWAHGNGVVQEIDRNPARYTNRGVAQAGRILGIISTVILGLGFAVLLVMVVVIFAAGSIVDDPAACRAERDTLETAMELHKARTGSYPTSVEVLLMQDDLARRPQYWTIVPGRGEVSPRRDVSFPPGCA
jgi:hypothetical protein